MHKPIQFDNISLSFPHKTCFEDFKAEVPYGSRIAIIGRNGSGKSSLLNMLQTAIKLPHDVCIGYVPQLPENSLSLSGGESFNKALSQALALQPNVLLLDEPTNHLDRHNKKSLLRMLAVYQGTLVVVSHDVELLRHTVDTLWHIDQGKIRIFSGNYDDYREEMRRARQSLEQELSRLNHDKKQLHHALMQEQARAKTSRAQGEKHIKQKKWPTVVSAAKAHRSNETSGRNKERLTHKQEAVRNRLAELYLPEIIKPTFSLTSADMGQQTLLNISDASVGYHMPILSNIHLSLQSGERLAIVGDNGSGKSTLIKAMMNEPTINKSGSWLVPHQNEIGYLDQSYHTLCARQTVLSTIESLVPTWNHAEVRKHLNAFLFRKNEEVNAIVNTLSGGERARLSLAQIAAKTPKLLILDEITNNLDLETREHVIQILQEYPGAMIVISHDADFLAAIGVTAFYLIKPKDLTISRS